MEPRVVMETHQGNGGGHSRKVRQTSLGDKEMTVFISQKKGFCLRLASHVLQIRGRPLGLGRCDMAS